MFTSRNAAFVCALIIMTAFIWGANCSDNNKAATVQEGLLTYSKGEAITFTITGKIDCDQCINDDVEVSGMEVCLSFGGATEEPNCIIKNGLETFTFEDVHASPDQQLSLKATVLLDGKSRVPSLSGYEEIEAPNENGKVIALTIDVPSSQNK